MTPNDIAAGVERNLHSRDIGFRMPEATLYSVTSGGSEVTEVASSPDIYVMLQSIDAQMVATFSDFLAIATTGLAAPLEEDGSVPMPPGENPRARRVRVVIVANAGSFVSVLRFEDSPEDVIVEDNGEMEGPLAEAMKELFTHQ